MGKYDKEAKRLGIRSCGNFYSMKHGEIPMFQHDDDIEGGVMGVGSFVIEPGETLEQAFIRAKSRYKNRENVDYPRAGEKAKL